MWILRLASGLASADLADTIVLTPLTRLLTPLLRRTPLLPLLTLLTPLVLVLLLLKPEQVDVETTPDRELLDGELVHDWGELLLDGDWLLLMGRVVVKDMYLERDDTREGWNLINAGVEEVALSGEVSGDEGGVRVAMFGVDLAVNNLLVDVNSLPTVWWWWWWFRLVV